MRVIEGFFLFIFLNMSHWSQWWKRMINDLLFGGVWKKKSSNERHADLLQTFIQQVQAAGFGPNGWPKPSWSHEWHLFKPVCTYLFIWSRYVHAHPHKMWFAQVMSLDPHPLLLLEQYSCQLIRGVSGPQ